LIGFKRLVNRYFDWLFPRLQFPQRPKIFDYPELAFADLPNKRRKYWDKLREVRRQGRLSKDPFEGLVKGEETHYSANIVADGAYIECKERERLIAAP